MTPDDVSRPESLLVFSEILRNWSGPIFSAALASHILARLLLAKPLELYKWHERSDKLKLRMQQTSEETFRKIVPAWQLVNDMVVVLYFSYIMAIGESIPTSLV